MNDVEPRRRRGTAAETRRRLVAATLELLRTGGEAAVTTVSVTQAAGIAQSAFYRHFSRVEDCLVAAAAEGAAAIRAAVADSRRATTPEPLDWVRFYQGLFDLVETQRPLAELFLRYHADRLALGGIMSRLFDDLCADLAADLSRQLTLLGLTAPPGVAALVSEALVASFLASAEAFLRGTPPGSAERAAVLATLAVGGCEAQARAIAAASIRPV